MTRRTFLQATGALALPTILSPRKQKDIRFRKHVLDHRFVAEGVAVGDVNRDGKLDIIAGNVWYEAPNWIPHEIAPVPTIDPAKGYSNCFNSWMEDLNHDGYPDQIVIGMPGERCYWRENPKGKDEPWKEHPIWHSACNESPLFVDLFKNRKRVLVMGYDSEYLAWFEPSSDPHMDWQCHNVSGLKGAGSQRYDHGLGVGDINGDGKNEILTRQGYYVMGSDHGQPWTFVKADLGEECAQMAVLDLNGDRRPDAVSSSAHHRGVWWHEQLRGGGFQSHLIDDTISETHSLIVANFGGKPNIVTGKRFYAHPPGVDPGSDEPALLVRYELNRSISGVEWIKYVIDENSGVGTQFVIQDMNGDGLLDIVVSNKKGVFLFEQSAL